MRFLEFQPVFIAIREIIGSGQFELLKSYLGLPFEAIILSTSLHDCERSSKISSSKGVKCLGLSDRKIYFFLREKVNVFVYLDFPRIPQR